MSRVAVWEEHSFSTASGKRVTILTMVRAVFQQALLLQNHWFAPADQ